MRRTALIAALVVVSVVACSDGSDQGDADASGPTDVTVGVAFDGSSCTVESADPIAPGDHVFILTSTQDVVPDVAVLRLPEGVSYEEFAAAQTPGGVLQGYVGEAAVSFGSLPDLDPDQKARRYIVEQGQYAVAAIALDDGWVCGPLDITG